MDTDSSKGITNRLLRTNLVYLLSIYQDTGLDYADSVNLPLLLSTL